MGVLVSKNFTLNEQSITEIVAKNYFSYPQELHKLTTLCIGMCRNGGNANFKNKFLQYFVITVTCVFASQVSDITKNVQLVPCVASNR